MSRDTSNAVQIRGVTVGRRRMPWQKLWHNDLEAPLLSVGLQAAGVYLWLRVQAGKAWNDGALLIGDNPAATKREVAAWVAKKLGGERWKEHQTEATEILNDLRLAGLVVIGKGQVVYLVNWMVEQSRAPSPDAERQRRHRGRGQDEVEDEDVGPGAVPPAVEDPEVARREAAGHLACEEAGRRSGPPPARAPDAPTPPASAAPTSTPRPTAYGFDRPGPERDLSHARHGSESESDAEKEERRISSNSNSTAGRSRPTPTAAEAGGVGASGSHVQPDIYAMDPVDAACFLTGERGQWSRNGFAAAYRRAGRDVFTTALGEFRAAKQDGIMPKTTWGGMFHGILGANERRRG